MTNVRKYTGQTADEVERMNEDFKKWIHELLARNSTNLLVMQVDWELRQLLSSKNSLMVLINQCRIRR